MDLDLKDKVVIVTGGAKGIGAAIVRACAAEGAVPVIVDRDADAGAQLRNELRSQGGACGAVTVELSTPENCSRAVDQALKTFGRLDALVNNAGRNDRVGLEHGNPDEYVVSLQRNLVHYYSMAHYCLPHLKRSEGAIVKHRFKNRGHRAGRHFRLRLLKRRDHGPYAGMGGRAVALQHPRKYDPAG